MTAPCVHDRPESVDPLAALSDQAVADLIGSLRQLIELLELLELHHHTRLDARRSAFDDAQLDMWNGGNPF